jgi:hypothetical protein
MAAGNDRRKYSEPDQRRITQRVPAPLSEDTADPAHKAIGNKERSRTVIMNVGRASEPRCSVSLRCCAAALLRCCAAAPLRRCPAARLREYLNPFVGAYREIAMEALQPKNSGLTYTFSKDKTPRAAQPDGLSTPTAVTSVPSLLQPVRAEQARTPIGESRTLEIVVAVARLRPRRPVRSRSTVRSGRCSQRPPRPPGRPRTSRPPGRTLPQGRPRPRSNS